MVCLEVVNGFLVDIQVAVIYDEFKVLYVFLDMFKRGDKAGVKEDGDAASLDQGVFQAFFTQVLISGDDDEGLRRSTY